MVEVPTFVWIIAAAITAFAILGFANALASEAQHQTDLHQLKKQVIDLRCLYLRKMIESFGLEEPDGPIGVVPGIGESGSDPGQDSRTEHEPAAAA